MANPMYGQNKADSHIDSQWVLCSAAGATQPAVIISSANVGHAIAPFAAKVTALMFNLTVATTVAAAVLTVADAAANAISAVSVPVQLINTGGVLALNGEDADATVAEGESVSVTSGGESSAGAAMIWLKFERI